MPPDLFSPDPPVPPRAVIQPTRLGHADYTYRDASAILTTATGFMDGYDYTLNPYSGCAFGCSYCYAAFFNRNKQLIDDWGKWVTVKQNALALLRKKRSTSVIGKLIYCSSVTDPYQPIEKKLELTRDLLQELVQYQPRLVIQTRAPLVTRDIDVLKRFDKVQVNMTVTTDDEDVRKAFEGFCPGNKPRLKAIAEVQAAGILSVITMTPLLPVRDPYTLAQQLLDTGVQQFIIQPFHATRGKFVAGTRDEAVRISEELGWTPERYAEVAQVLRETLPNLGEGKEGFAPLI